MFKALFFNHFDMTVSAHLLIIAFIFLRNSCVLDNIFQVTTVS